MTTDRIKEIQSETAYPNSTSVQQALLKVWNECEQEQKQVKNCSIPNISTRTEMRKQAITVFELTKGFTVEPTDNAMKTALEMADYVMQLTNDL